MGKYHVHFENGSREYQMTIFPEAGDVIFVQGNHAIAQGISLAQHLKSGAGSKVTHVALVITLDTIIESQFTHGVRIQRIQDWFDERKNQYGAEEFIVLRSCKKDRREKSVEILNSAIYQFHADYAALEAITQLPTDNGKSICSDLAAKILHRANFCDLGRLISLKQVWPGELYSVLLNESFEEIDTSAYWPSANQERSSADFVLELQVGSSEMLFNYERVRGKFCVAMAQMADIAMLSAESIDPVLYFFQIRHQTKKNLFEFMNQFSANFENEGFLKEFGKTIPYNWKHEEALTQMHKNRKLTDELNQRLVQYHFFIGLKGADESPLRIAVNEVRDAYKSNNSNEIEEALIALFRAYVEVKVRFVAITGFQPEEFMIRVNDRSSSVELNRENNSILNFAHLSSNLTDSYKILANWIITLRDFLSSRMSSDLVPTLESEVDSQLEILEQSLLTR